MRRQVAVHASLLALLMVSACSGGSPTALPTVEAAASPSGLPTNEAITASVEVQPGDSASMSFLIGGRVAQVLVAEGDVVKAGQPLVVLETPELDYAVVSAQAEADSAELNQTLQSSSRQYKVWNGRRWIWTRGLPEVRRAAEARLEQALGSLEVARADLAQGTLVAPYDGTVVSIAVKPGEMAPANEAVLVFADLSDMQVVTTDLSEREIARVRVGQGVRVALKALDEELTGVVAAIDPMAARSEDGDVVYQVTIELDEQPPMLFWGMTGEATIEVGED